MATYHCSVKVGTKGRAAVHAAYISREETYEYLDRADRRAVAGSDVVETRQARPEIQATPSERGVRLKPAAASHAEYIQREGKHQAKGELEYREHGNLPAWAKDNAAAFWQASDAFERKNGSTYREIEVALPRELNREQRIALVQEFVREQIGEKHAYSFAIHNPKAAIAGGEQPHAHIMFSERVRDGIERDPRQYFRRYNAKSPERGGCRKGSFGGDVERLVQLRERWAQLTNRALEGQGTEARVDHRSLKDQGVARAPEKHLGPVEVRRGSKVLMLTDYRSAAKAREQAEQEVQLIDVKTTLAQALRERTVGAAIGSAGARPGQRLTLTVATSVHPPEGSQVGGLDRPASGSTRQGGGRLVGRDGDKEKPSHGITDDQQPDRTIKPPVRDHQDHEPER